MSDSMITKKAIAFGLKELMKKKSFEKITIADITEICGLNRQTFYYHFQDKFELVDWIYYNEAIALLTNDLTFETWGTRVQQMLTVMKNEAYFYQNALKASGQNGFEDYLFSVARELFCGIIDRIAPQGALTEEERDFIAEFYSYGIVGIILSWARKGMKETPEYITDQLKNLVYDTQKFAVIRYMQKS
ncbi:MAG: dihydroxyacetone kinase transcriptional activator DhaS [Bacillota bacterium]|nr:dihydroxyacetone kinase transcriptional activator DhaS [Bacillota bacterium]